MAGAEQHASNKSMMERVKRRRYEFTAAGGCAIALSAFAIGGLAVAEITYDEALLGGFWGLAPVQIATTLKFINATIDAAAKSAIIGFAITVVFSLTVYNIVDRMHRDEGASSEAPVFGKEDAERIRFTLQEHAAAQLADANRQIAELQAQLSQVKTVNQTLDERLRALEPQIMELGEALKAKDATLQKAGAIFIQLKSIMEQVKELGEIYREPDK